MTMMPEEILNQAIWWVLQELQKENITRLSTEEPIYFEYQTSKSEPSIPSWYDQQRAIRVLENKQAIKILSKKYNGPLPGSTAEAIGVKPAGVNLKILEKFDGIYTEFHKLLNSRRDEEIEPEQSKQDEKIKTANQSNFLSSYKLIFNPYDGITHYRGADYQFTGKSKALLNFLSTSKNTTFPLEEIKTKCNPNIANTRSHFKGDKDMRDTVNYIRKQLKVKRSEFFPIRKQDNNWIWIEK